MSDNNRPSYGVFMVDIFASSVGIFILVSLLYIIMSAASSSSAVMLERFKTLIKRDKVPIHDYRIASVNEPLHNWAVRARHARDAQEPLIILLRDRVMLYHTRELLTKEQIVDSGRVQEYYLRYNKTGRLFLEIHYNDAYHVLYAKINQALPPTVRLWTHWAYNAGNVDNPNPQMGIHRPGARPGGSSSVDPNQDPGAGFASEQGGNGSGHGGEGQGTGLPGGQDGNGEQFGLGGQGGQEGEGMDGQGSLPGEAGEGEGQDGQAGQGEQGNGEEAQWPQDESAEGLMTEEQVTEQVQEQITQQLNDNQLPEDFLERYLNSGGGEGREGNDNDRQGDGSGQGTSHSGLSQSRNTGQAGGASGNERQQSQGEANATLNGGGPGQQSKGDAEGQSEPAEEQAQVKLEEKEQVEDAEAKEAAENYIKQNAFLAVPMFAPLADLRLDILVPGYEAKQIKLAAAGIYVHRQPGQGRTDEVTLTRGDYLVPDQSVELSAAPGWFPVKIMNAGSLSDPRQGWLFGVVRDGVFMIQVFENTVSAVAVSTDGYWFKPGDSEDKTKDLFRSMTEGK